jgi:hypothetical protein
MNFSPSPALDVTMQPVGHRRSDVACSIVIVCFHSLHELGPCIDMLRAGPPGAGVEVIVVNNAQSDAAGVAACFDRKASGRQLQ